METKILFICHGNICRSPMAEFVFKKLIKDDGIEESFEVDSAATSREEIGNDIYPPAKRCLVEHKVPFEVHSARQIIKQDVEYYDYIIAMEDYNIRNLERMIGPSHKFKRLLDFTDTPENISDPWYTGDFETAYAEIDKGCKAFLEKMIGESNE